ncbi:MAG: ABC transporter ATP-binding protein [Armatimonadota bacterium]|nr:ABC transporter ATP-binding protein [Armatimonadota bacterium]
MAVPILTDNLSKTYKLPGKQTRKALDGLSIEVPEGVIFGFLGPNGAGKTTTIKILLDFIRPTSGTASLFGQSTDNPAVRRLVGYLPEQPYFHKFLKPTELLSLHASLCGIPSRAVKSAVTTALERVAMTHYADTPIGKLSKGLTQRVGIAQALVGNPKLLILDEPTSGLDPIGRRHVRDLLIELKREGHTIFLSSHLLSEVENLCDIVAVIKNGSLVAFGPPEQIRNATTYIRVYTQTAEIDCLERLRFLGVQIEQQTDRMIFRVEPEKAYELFRALEQLGLQLLRVETERESLEEAFLRLAA